jgi:hypothetical protein
LSNPAAIAFKITNVGLLSLRYPLALTHVCRVGLDWGSTTTDPPPRECDKFIPMPNDLAYSSIEWLSHDQNFTIGLGDNTFIIDPGWHINYLNLIIRVGYYPWYSPFRQYEMFGFRSWKGNDGKLYWRDYVPNSVVIPTDDDG